MRAWRTPEPPRLPGPTGPSGTVPDLLIYDHASGTLVPSLPRNAGPTPVAALYTCGITPYDATHLGHSATYVASDLLVRTWLDAGAEVRYVQNVTDIDDPLLERATATGEDWQVLAARQIELFGEDMAALRVLPPRDFVGAVEAMPLIIEAVTKLVGRGGTYALDGDRYVDVTAAPGFGRVSGWTTEQMLEVYADRGGDPGRPGKRHPLDWRIWSAERPGEPSWDGGRLGRGRPGWHIECATIARHYLGLPIDVQAGGSDLVFPHHEMGAAESAMLHPDLGERLPARAYAYQGMVGLHGEKMSKSKGNLVFSSQLRADGVDPMAIRLAVLAHHYRSDWDWTDADLKAAEVRLGRWRAAAVRPGAADGSKLLAGVRESLGADLDAPAALGVVDDWVAATLAGDDTDQQAPSVAMRVCDALLGVRLDAEGTVR